MPEKFSFRVNEVAELTVAERHWIKRWAEAGILRPEPDSAGSGAHRRFSVAEVLIAAPLAQLARLGLPIGHIKRIADAIRDQVIDSKGGAFDVDRPWLAAYTNALGGGQAWLIIASRPPRTIEPTVVVDTNHVPDLSEDRPGIGPLINYPMIVIVDLAEVWGRVFDMLEASGLPSR